MNIKLEQTFGAIVFCILFSINTLNAQTAYQPNGLVQKVITGIQIDLASVSIKDNDGKILDAPTFIQMSQSGKYNMETYVDEQERIKEIVVRPKQDGETAKDNRQLSGNSLKDELEKIRMKDQTLRMLMMPGGCMEKTYGSNSEEFRYFVLLMAQEDKKNQEQVVKILDENGWPGISQVGENANSAVFLVIQHAPVEIQEKYFPLLKESAEKGESKMADMALMDDRIRMHRKERQWYGSQTVTIEGKSYVWPIENAKNVDDRRNNVQLPPLADYLKLMGLTYPQDELPAELFR